MDLERSLRFKPKNSKSLAPPKALTSKAARAFWKNAVRDYLLEDHHITMLVEVCSALQRAEEAREILASEGLTLVDSRNNRLYAHPCVAIARDAQTFFLRGVRELGFDLADQDAARPPGRQGKRQR